ncbi:MAG: AmmeMemoRadiSam system protein B [Candidatus Thermoplasmatota archaeon]|jgi:AmmeMemoRadiSam system protein B|nr:AmmeMemoRadiSam system protein B [Candidatus Thermoplasmatota archaeon]MCL5962948.1 AmmeMemoRadiSam system protein B [Candidatus Thermoplasmatota archaeon]
MRKPAVSGSFYPSDRKVLLSLIERSFTHKFGPGSLPASPDNIKSDRLKAIVVPHAGYIYSGPVAAHSYLRLARNGMPDSIIILGVNHYGIGSPVAITLNDFETPLGIAKVDAKLGMELINGPIVNDDLSHLREHSIEVQIPFLQYIFGDNLKFVPILIQYTDVYSTGRISKYIKNVIKNRNIVVIASTDFSHYVPREVAYRNDKKAIDMIEKLDPDGLEDVVKKYDISMCGIGPVLTMLFSVDAKKATLLKYATSGDMEPMHDVVGYASMEIV